MTTQSRTALNITLVSAASLLQIINQFVFFSFLAAFFGASRQTDALAAALVLPTVLAAIVTGSIAYVLVPELVRQFESQAEDSSVWQLAFYVGTVTTLVGGVISGILWLQAGPICHWLYDDMSDADCALTVRLLKILSIQVVLNGWISWAQAVHHSRHHFVLPALGGVIGTGVGLGMVAMWGKQEVGVFAWAINLGAAVSALVHMVPLARRWVFPKADGTSVIRMVAAFWPLLLGAAFIRIDPVIDRVLASELDGGSIAHINYAQRIMMALLAVGTSGLSVIAFPQLAQRHSNEGQEGLAAHFALAFRRLLLLVIPIVIGISMFSTRIIRDLLERGAFTSGDSRTVGLLVVVMMGMFVGASAGELLARAFYVVEDTKTPTIVGVVALILGLIAKYCLFKQIGIWGIACGVSGYFVLSATIMGVILAKRLGKSVFEGALVYAGQAVLASWGACACCWLIFSVEVPSLSTTWVAGPVGVLTYALVLLMLNNVDAKHAFRLATGAIARRWS